MSREDIKHRFGPDGISGFHAWGGFATGSFTDDTQMSLATAVGCIRAYHRFEDRGLCHPATIVYHRYLEWYQLQKDPKQRRAPGNTCMSALGSRKMGTIEYPINDSKGCGGVMRTAPVGLAFPAGDAFQQGMECAAITHGHPSGYLSAGFLSELIARLLAGEAFEEAIEASCAELRKYRGYEETLRAIQLAKEKVESHEEIEVAIPSIGQGWVGEEALGISIYCSLKYSGDWEKGVLASVNHSGDSDSTGSITGAILGTSLGIRSIPANLVNSVEDSGKIFKIANDMFKIFRAGEELSPVEYPPN